MSDVLVLVGMMPTAMAPGSEEPHAQSGMHRAEVPQGGNRLVQGANTPPNGASDQGLEQLQSLHAGHVRVSQKDPIAHECFNRTVEQATMHIRVILTDAEWHAQVNCLGNHGEVGDALGYISHAQPIWEFHLQLGF